MNVFRDLLIVLVAFPAGVILFNVMLGLVRRARKWADSGQ